MARRAKTIDLLRVVDLLQEHITPALCRTVFGAVRKTERQRAWTLEALIRFWTAVVLRAPKALTQALADSLEGRDPMFPRVEASPEAFFQRCRDLRPAFFAEVFHRFTARLVTAVPPRYAAEMAAVRRQFGTIVILDGSRLAAIAHRLKILRNEPIKLVISDQKMPDMSGIEFFRIIRERHPHVCRIMLTGDPERETIIKAINEGEVYRFIPKPWSNTMVRVMVYFAFETIQLEEENRRLVKALQRQLQFVRSLDRDFPYLSALARQEEAEILLVEAERNGTEQS